MKVKVNSGQLRSVIESQQLTQQEFARRGRLSRGRLVQLLSESQPTVRKRTAELLAKAAGLPVTALIVEGGLAEYLQIVSEMTAEIEFRGLGLPQFHAESLIELFIDLRLRRESSVDRDSCGGESGPRWTDETGDTSAEPIRASQCLGKHDRMVLVGDPGGGKSTILRYLAYCTATGKQSGEQEERMGLRVPVLVRLAEFSRALAENPDVDPAAFAADAAGRKGRVEVDPILTMLRNKLDAGDCLVLLDGLDEVGGEKDQARVIRCLRDFVNARPRNRYVLTSRRIGFESQPWEESGFTVFRVLGCSDDQVHEFAQRWVTLRHRGRGRKAEKLHERIEKLRTAIRSNPRVRALAANPLMLTVLALLDEARGSLPRRRVDLYQRIVDVLLDTWESSKLSGSRTEPWRDLDLDAREFRWLLSDVALAMQKAELTLAARWWLAAEIESFLQKKLGKETTAAKAECDKVLRWLHQRSGLLVERGPDLFGFSHRTLQEYFVALGVIQQAEACGRGVAAELRGWLFHPKWSEVVRLVAAQVAHSQAESLVTAILDDPDPVGRFLRRGSLLALRCLIDGAAVGNRAIVADAFGGLDGLGRSKWLGITIEALDVLKGFGGTRHEDLAKSTVRVLLECAQRELEDHDFRLLHQHAHWGAIDKQVQEAFETRFRNDAAAEVNVRVAGVEHVLSCINLTLRFKDPQRWFSSACEILEDPVHNDGLKIAVVRELGRDVLTDGRARRRLKKLLSSGACVSERVRAACARALAPASDVKRHGSRGLLLRLLDDERDRVRAASARALAPASKSKERCIQPLLRRLRDDKSDRVRAACAAALRDVASHDAIVRERLVKLMRSTEAAQVRAEAIRGLSKAVIDDATIGELIHEVLLSPDEPEDVRCSSAWALVPEVDRNSDITATFQTLLADRITPRVQRVAAQILATAVAEERIPWDNSIVERVEHVLMNLDAPCVHVLDCLEELATAREVRRGLRLEHILRECLKPLANSIRCSFVFGSTARLRQTTESDIDLLVIGDVSLRVISPALRDAERVLGRRINPALYSVESFRERIQSGDPFLLEVVRREKLPVLGSGSTAPEELEHELRTLAAERLAGRSRAHDARDS